MKSLLVTGAGGFIGRHVVRIAAERGIRVLATDKRVHDPLPGIDYLEHHGNSDCPLPALPFPPDAAILLAWPVPPRSYLDCIENVDALAYTIATGRRLVDLGCRRIVGAGTCAEYGAPCESRIREDHPVAPQNLYAACKVSAQLVLAQLCAQAGVGFSWARIFNPYGPGEPSERLLPTIAKHIATKSVFTAGSGTQLRDYVHVEDVARGLVVLSESTLSGPANICTGIPMTLIDIMRTMALACGGDDGAISFGAKPDRPWDPPSLVGDPGRLSGLGWQPRSPATGITNYAKMITR